MYSLKVADGSIIEGLRLVGEHTFEVDSSDPSIYFKLSDFNLSFAVLYDDNGDIIELYIDYIRQNFTCQNNVTRFKLINVERLEDVTIGHDRAVIRRRNKWQSHKAVKSQHQT